MKKRFVILSTVLALCACNVSVFAMTEKEDSSQELTLISEYLTKDGAATDQSEDPIYQVALLQSLAQGYFDGIATVSELKEHGDTGIGTFDGLNGEMIVLDGVVYRAAGDGTIQIPDEDERMGISSMIITHQLMTVTNCS